MTEAAATQKVDPETLVLRAQPRRVMRFKRHLLIGAAAVSCMALAGVAWMGLGVSPTKPVAAKELYDADKAADRPETDPASATGL